MVYPKDSSVTAGFAFVECAGNAQAALLLEALSNSEKGREICPKIAVGFGFGRDLRALHARFYGGDSAGGRGLKHWDPQYILLSYPPPHPIATAQQSNEACTSAAVRKPLAKHPLQALKTTKPPSGKKRRPATASLLFPWAHKTPNSLPCPIVDQTKKLSDKAKHEDRDECEDEEKEDDRQEDDEKADSFWATPADYLHNRCRVCGVGFGADADALDAHIQTVHALNDSKVVVPAVEQVDRAALRRLHYGTQPQIQQDDEEQHEKKLKKPNLNSIGKTMRVLQAASSPNPDNNQVDEFAQTLMSDSTASSSLGAALLKKMGWREGEGLGVEGRQGITRPIIPKARPRNAGLGSEHHDGHHHAN